MVEFLPSYFFWFTFDQFIFFRQQISTAIKKNTVKKWIKSKINVLLLETLNLDIVSTRKNKRLLS